VVARGGASHHGGVILPVAAARAEQAARGLKDDDGTVRRAVRVGALLEHRPMGKPE
jgi:hypothetical protein